jgi:signal transduction histidine kinase
MTRKQDLFDYESMAFFGSVNASISHELKNIMAIISETAGLLSDLTEMAKRGKSIELDMLTSSTESIVEEIQRGFTTVRQMNRFSHSVDTPIGPIDLMEILDLVRNLCGYLSFAGKMHIHPPGGVTPIVLTCPFMLQAVIYQLVYQVFQQARAETELDVTVRSRDNATWQIIFAGCCVNAFEAFPGDRIKRMADRINVSVRWDRALDHLEVNVPFSIDGVA